MNPVAGDGSTKPYLIRALHQWCTDHNYSPYIAVSVDESVHVPRAYVKVGEIVLNVSYVATNRLDISNEAITFEARFNGQAQQLYVPITHVSAIFAKENGHGMAFDVQKPLAIAKTKSLDQPGSEVLALVEPSALATEKEPALESKPKRAKPQLAVAPTHAADSAEAFELDAGDTSSGKNKSGATKGKPKLTRVK